MPKNKIIKLPFNREYCSFERARNILNNEKTVKAKIEIEDFWHWEESGIFKPLVPIGNYLKNRRVRILISHHNSDGELGNLPHSEFCRYVKALQVHSYNIEGFKLNFIRLFKIDNVNQFNSNTIEATCEFTGHLHARSFDVHDDFGSLRLSTEVHFDHTPVIITLTFDIERDNSDYERFKSDWRSDVMICETGLNEIYNSIVHRPALAEPLGDTTANNKVHGNTRRNKAIDAEILEFALELKEQFPDKCQTNASWERLIDEKSLLKWEDKEKPPRGPRHITDLLSKYMNSIK